MAATSKLTILIEAKNNASSGIKQAEGDLKNLDKAAGNIAGGLGSLAGAAGIAGIGALGAAAAGAVVEMAKGAAETERLKTAFDSLAASAGESGDAMLAAMQQASQGTISNSDLMLTANKAMLLGVADSAQEMAQLMDVAAARGKAMGETTAQAFSDLVTAVGRLSAPIADNLGITIDAEKAYAAYAQQIGTTSDQLTEAQKKQAFLNDVIKSSTDIVQANRLAGADAAANYERMDAALTNAKDALGELFSPAIAVIAQNLAAAVTEVTEAITSDTFEKASNATAGLWKELQRLTQEYQAAEAATAVGLIHPEVMAQAQQDLENVTGQLRAYGAEYNKAAAVAGLPLLDLAALERGIMAFDNTAVSIAKIEPAAQAAKMGLDAMGNRLPWLTGQLAALQAQSDATSSALAGIAGAAIGAIHSAASAAVGIMPTGEIAKIYDETSKKVAEQTKVMHELGMTTSEIDFRTQEYAKNASMPFDIAVEAARAADKAMTHHAASVDQVSKAYSDLEGKVQGVLSGALDPGVGVNPDDLLPRADAINEDARRLADVAVNGWASPWAEYFKKEFPDQFQEMAASNDIKTGAAIMLRNFQDGLEPELINKEAAKERVRKMLIGDQNMAELATEIATELSQEMGVPMQQALAAAQGSLGGGSGMGTEAATSFADGAAAALDEGNGGGAFVTKFTDQMKAKYGLLATAGTDAAKTWGDAFLAKVGDSVPAQLVNLLTDLVTPQVVARMAQQGTLTRATP